MVSILLIVLTLLSCFLFEIAKVPEQVTALVASYRHQFKLMSDKGLSDEEKQKQLLVHVSRQLLLLLKLILGIALFVAPFLSLFILGQYFDPLQPEILFTWKGILIPTATVVLYILIKRYHGRLF